MNHRRARLLFLLLILPLSLALSGCSRSLGWGLVLWSFGGAEQAVSAEGEPAPSPEPPAERVGAGTLLPVLIKSNINQVYVVEMPGTRAKAEVPVWKIEVFRSRREAKARARDFEPYARLYATALRDGLVLREEARNTSSQVYRLRRDQEVKLLERVDGEEVFTGGTPLPGDWYLAMGEDGTRGYIFSNQLRIYDEAEGPALTEAAPADQSAQLEPLFVQSWRPAYFHTMIEEGRVDLERFSSQYGLFVDGVRRQIRVEYPGASRFFNYSNILAQADGSFRFEGLPLVINFRESDLLEATIESDYGAGTHAFAPFNQDVREIVRKEELRRRNVLADIIAAGDRFVSDDWGALTISRTGRFIWAAYDKLIPEGLPEYSGDAGAIDPALFLGPALEGAWDGGISLTFDGGRRPRVDFVYRSTPGGLDLQLVRPIDKEWAVVKTLSEPPLVIKFRRTDF